MSYVVYKIRDFVFIADRDILQFSGTFRRELVLYDFPLVVLLRGIV